MSQPGDKQSIWKKEITLRRKPRQPERPKEKGVRVPSAVQGPAKPESVAELLRPLAEQTIDPLVLPPVTPLAAGFPVMVEPVASEPDEAPTLVTRPAAGPAPKRAPERAPELPSATLDEAPRSAPAPVLPPEPALPPIEPEEPRPPGRIQRKASRRAAKEQAREEKRRTKQPAGGADPPEPAQHVKLVGLKVGGSQIAAVQLVNKGGPRAVRMARMPLESGIVVGGELREPEELAAALKTFFRKNKLPRTGVRLGISNTRIGVRTFEISGIEDPKQLANAIRFRAQEALPIPLDEAVVDHRILEDRVGEGGVRSRRVLLVVAHRELVNRYVAACSKAGLKLVGIDLEAFAMLRALGDPAESQAEADDAGLVCIAIGHDRSTLAVSNGRVCEFTRVLAWGGSSLDIAVARALDLTVEEAEPLKRLLSLSEKGEVPGLDAYRADAARAAMAAEVEAFTHELVSSLRFYQEQPGSLGIGEMLLTGGGSACGGLPEEVERLTGVAVRVADPLARVKMARKLRKFDNGSIGSFAIAIGLGIED